MRDMAGIGFTLKKLFQDETFTNRGKAYLYSALVAAGPWLAAVVTVNILIFLIQFSTSVSKEKDLFMGTIVYSFVFSQILTAPWQMIITRYVSDKLYSMDYDSIRPSYTGLNKIVFLLSFVVSVAFYFNKPLPLYYKIMAAYLFMMIAMIWVLMVFLSAVKNYELIGKAYIYGGILSIILAVYILQNPLKFPSLIYASNLLLAYLIGLSLTFLMLLYNFLSTFYFGNDLEFDFIRYLTKYPSLFFIGLFYTMGLWIDDVLMWFSIAGIQVLETYRYAPVYDNAVFLAYLTIIPSMVLFLVSVETEFYDHYKKYYGLANKKGTYEEIESAKEGMKKSIYSQLLKTFQIQALISFTLFLLAGPIFQFLNFSIIIRNIFRVCVLGALCNIFVLLIILVLLYYEVRIQAVLLSMIFFFTNLFLTSYFVPKGINYYGYGFFLGSFITLILSVLSLTTFMRRLTFVTFARQPLFITDERGIFIKISDLLNNYQKLRDDKQRTSVKETTV